MHAIPARFSTEVRQHLLLNFTEFPEQPLILGIFGAPGEGKTYQLRGALSQAKVEHYSVSAADMESDHAGEPAKLVLSEYVKAARAIESGVPSALVIDDIDTTIGEWAQNTGTVNHQQVLAQIMHLADHPNVIERFAEDRNRPHVLTSLLVRRVPVFVTGNDPGKIYSPLRRPGRMTVLHWEPTPAERQEMICGIFQGMLSADRVAHLLQRYPHQPVAFFASLRMATIRRFATTVLDKAATDMAGVAREPELHRSFVQAALTRDMAALDSVASEEAEDLDSRTRASRASFLSDAHHAAPSFAGDLHA
jgi:ATPase family associated with various cellular activities (AAA)